MKSDRELLELAAKAAGHKVNWLRRGCGPYFMALKGDTEWNPLTDDGDALRLAVKLDFIITVNRVDSVTEVDVGYSPLDGFELKEFHEGDMYAATRRAIVRAAAAIGEKM